MPFPELITPIYGIITLLITGKGPFLYEQKVKCFTLPEKNLLFGVWLQGGSNSKKTWVDGDSLGR